MLDVFKPSEVKFNREIKIIALITLINRMGAVVVPFLSKYLKEGFGLDYSHIGWVMFCFGLGSLVGTFLSGKLADKLGAYAVMWFSLLGNGIIFLLLMNVHSFSSLCFFVFLLTAIADMYRPAMMVCVSQYTTKELKLPSLSLIRSASNLGMVVGPVLGAYMIYALGYKALFIVDGFTCIVAGLLLLLLVKPQKETFTLDLSSLAVQRFAPLKDYSFIINWVIAFITGYLYFQIFSIVPLFEKQIFKLSEIHTGLLFGFSGLLFILFEVKLVYFVQNKRFNDGFTIALGLALILLAYAVLMVFENPWALWIFMALMTFGNMLTFSFASGIVIKRSLKNMEGIFMSAFQMSYGFAHLVSSKNALFIIQNRNFATNWMFNVFLALFGIFLSFILFSRLKKERDAIKNKIADALFK